MDQYCIMVSEMYHVKREKKGEEDLSRDSCVLVLKASNLPNC